MTFILRPSRPTTRALFWISLLTSTANAEVLFEGYSKVISGGVHVGFTLSRYEFDAKKKQFIGTHFIQTSVLGGGASEGYKTVSDEKNLRPISLQYTFVGPSELKTIDGKMIDNNWVTETKSTNPRDTKSKAKKVKETTSFPKDGFFSSNLAYYMLKSKTGLKEKISVTYDAIAEEDGKFARGQAVVQSFRKWNGFDAFSVANEFKSVKFASEVTPSGQVLQTRSPLQAIETELVAKPEQATQGLSVSASLLKELFGDVPVGVKNVVSESYATSPPPPAGDQPQTMTKDPLPAGQGLHQKGK